MVRQVGQADGQDSKALLKAGLGSALDRENPFNMLLQPDAASIAVSFQAAISSTSFGGEQSTSGPSSCECTLNTPFSGAQLHDALQQAAGFSSAHSITFKLAGRQVPADGLVNPPHQGSRADASGR